MLSAFGIAEVARTSQPAILGTLTVIIDDLIRNTTGADWDDWLTLKPDAAERLSADLALFIREEHGFPPIPALPAAPVKVIDGELSTAA